MNVQETSIEAYYKIKDSGLLSELLLSHLEVFYEAGVPITARDAHEAYWRKRTRTERNLNQFRSKVTMLMDHGALTEMPEKVTCPVTGMTVTQYYVTNTVHCKVKTVPKKDRKTMALSILTKVGKLVVMSPEMLDELRMCYKLVKSL